MSLARACNRIVVSFTISLALSLTVGPAHASSSVSGIAVAGGTVTNASRAAMVGATVDLYAWPSDAVLKAMKVGQFVPTTLLATATTNSAGKYMLTVPAAKLKAAAVESGYANLEIFSSVGGFWFLPYQTRLLPAHLSAPVTVNLTSIKQLSCGKDPEGYAYNFTGMNLERERDPSWAVVGQGYIVKSKKTAGDKVQFNYDQATSHSQPSTLGVGLSGYGFDAGYKASGTNASTATQEQGYPSQEKNAWFRTMFSVGQFRGMRYGPTGVKVPHEKQYGQCPRTWTDTFGAVHGVHKCFWLIASTGWFGAASIQHPATSPRTPGKYCGPEPKGQVIKTSDEQAIQWSSGFELGASLGVKGAHLKASFSGSSQTGYDKNAQMVFKFGHAGVLCGTNHDPSRAALLVMRGSKP